MKGKRMLQTCTTELSELCEKLARKFSLPKVESDGGEIVFQGSTYRITHDFNGVNGEEVMYRDSLGWFSAFSKNKNLVYNLKNKFLNGRAGTLRETVLGTMIVVNLDELETPLSKEQCELVVRLSYLSENQLYKLIESHILG